jgi:hypothetical protein
MMRRWRSDLYRYGVRLTFDITIPNPGARLWVHYRNLADMEEEIHRPFVFSLSPGSLNDNNWSKQSILLERPPRETISTTLNPEFPFIDDDAARITRYGKYEFDVPEGYFLETADFTATVTPVYDHPHVVFWLVDDGSPRNFLDNKNPTTIKSKLPHLIGRSGRLAVVYEYKDISVAAIRLSLTFRRTPEHFENWQNRAWHALRDAALASHNAKVARLQDERDRLWQRLTYKDTLSLRRLEREELMREVLKWLLGPGFHPTPQRIDDAIEKFLQYEAFKYPTFQALRVFPGLVGPWMCLRRTGRRPLSLGQRS